MQIDDVGLFDALATEMNAHLERFQVLGDADMTVAVVMGRADGDFRVRIDFEVSLPVKDSAVEFPDRRTSAAWA